MARRTFLLWGGALATAVAGCSFLLNPTAQQCNTDKDCAARGGAFAGSTCIDNFCTLPSDAGLQEPTGWECVGNVQPAVPVKPQVQITLTFGDLIHPEVSVSADVQVRVCRKLDVTCASPISDSVHPDAAGHTVFTVDGGFDGYIEVNPAVNPPIYFPTLVFVASPVVDDYVYVPTSLLAIADLPVLVQMTGGGTVDATLGAVLFEAANCQRMPASGIVGTLDELAPDTRRFFIINRLPTQTANATDASGQGGFINVPVGVRTLSGTRSSDNLFIGTVSVLVRPGTFSYSLLAPQPL